MLDRRLKLRLSIDLERWELESPFHISGYTFDHVDVVLVTLTDGAHTGRGEAAGVYYLNDTPARIVRQLETVRATIEAGVTRAELRTLLPAGGARNAVDCALWDLEARRSGEAAWRLAGLQPPQPLLTTCTLGADAPDVMAKGATGQYPSAKALKLKLLGDDEDAERVRAVRRARADVWMGVDANQGFNPETFGSLLPVLVEAGVQLVEQPYPRGKESWLEGSTWPIPIAADESVQSLEDVGSLVGRFQVMNIKLDKCGGLTEALLMAAEARRLGLRVMVGNMISTSLAMAPALLLGQYCQVVDLDGPLFLRTDRKPSMVYDHGMVSAPQGLWG